MPDSQKKSILSSIWDWLTTYFGGNSTGVRNWLTITALASLGIMSIFGGMLGLTFASPLFFGLLIGFGAIMAAGIVGTLVSGIFSLYNDYQEYKKQPGSDKNYLLDLLGRLWQWIQDHPICTLALALALFIMIYFIISALLPGAIIIATPAMLLISHALGGLNLTFIACAMYAFTWSSMMIFCDMISRSWDFVFGNDFSKLWNSLFPNNTKNTNSEQDAGQKSELSNTTALPSKQGILDFARPLTQLENNTATLKPGEMVRYNPTIKVLTEITENSNEPGSYNRKFVNGPIEQITFICRPNKSPCNLSDFSSYLLIAYNQASKEYFFLNISQEQAKDLGVCQRFFQQFSGTNQDAKFDVLFFKVDPLFDASENQIIPAKNRASFIDEKDLFDQDKTPLRTTQQRINEEEGNQVTSTGLVHMRSQATKVSFTLCDKQLTKFSRLHTHPKPSREKYRVWDIENNEEPKKQPTSIPSPEKKS